MTRQTEVTIKMRQIVVDWMMELSDKLRLGLDTTFLAVYILDCTLSKMPANRDNIQCIAVVSMFIATKLEEEHDVPMGDFIYLSDNALTNVQICDCEREVLKAIDYRLNTPSPLQFLQRFSLASKNDLTLHLAAKYIIEMTMLDYSMLSFLPSQLAAGAVYLVNWIYNAPPYWVSPYKQFISHYHNRL